MHPGCLMVPWTATSSAHKSIAFWRRMRSGVERVLAPTLRPGDVVVMDNLGNHKASAVLQAIRAADAHLLFPPPYSPDPRAAKNSPPDCFLYAPHPSNRHSPSSNTGCEMPQPDPEKPSGVLSDQPWTNSPPKNAPTIWSTQATLPRKPETL